MSPACPLQLMLLTSFQVTALSRMLLQPSFARPVIHSALCTKICHLISHPIIISKEDEQRDRMEPLKLLLYQVNRKRIIITGLPRMGMKPVFACGLFNDAVSSSDYIASN
jgi:hypothetical protein